MKHCRIIISIFLVAGLLPLTLWSGVPVVDDSDNYAMAEAQQAYEQPVEHSRYRDSRLARGEGAYSNSVAEESPLVKEENYHSNSRTPFNDNAKLIDKIQTLRQEIQELRGQLEVQAHDLKILQQQQLAFYKDVDARLGSAPKTELSLNTTLAPQAEPLSVKTPLLEPSRKSSPPSHPKNEPLVSRVNPANEQVSYLAAYELIKTRQFDEALHAMENFVQKYPQSGFTANAQYWLGELYLLKKDYARSREHFEIVLERFPSSSKSAAAMLKDGYVFAASGDVLSAKKRLQQVIKTYPNTRVAQLASEKLVSLNAS